MGVSLSTTPSLIPTAPQPSSNPRHALHAGTIRCNRIECDGADEDRFRRRDVLKCVGATLSMGKPDIIPSLLTLALNDAMTYDKFVGYKIWGPKWINTIQEEFEAPMWVDLTLEAKANDQDIDDKWFHISHPFHRCSSRQLKSAFSHSGEESENLDFNLYGPSSPKLPSSVSRSRGKHHMSGNWGKENGGFSINKQHPVKSLSGETSWIQ